MDIDPDPIRNMKTFLSPHGDIYIGAIADGLEKVISSLNPSAIILIADENTARHCLPGLKEVIATDLIISVPPGERHKSLDNCGRIWSFLMHHKADKSALVLNVGGGMICDLGGFAASCYQRGIRFGHIPTSVLAMADAAIGGKTGVNFQGYKNYIGRIEWPSVIWIDPSFIKTLPLPEVKNGLTEIVKHAIIGSRALWNTLSGLEHPDKINWNHLLSENTSVKLHVVESDPYETGLRKILNFGHTIGHALESHFLEASLPLSHGQAVTLGMLAESKMANDLGLLDTEDFDRITGMIHRLMGLVEVTLPSIESLQPWLQGDKKRYDGQSRFSLPDKIGSCGWNIPVDTHLVNGSLDWLSTQVKAPSRRLSVEK